MLLFLKHTKKFILLVIAMQILNNGLFAQDILYNSGEAAIVRSASHFIAKKVFHKIPSTPKHKHQKHRHASLKHSDTKFVSYTSFYFKLTDNIFVKNNFYYFLHLPSFVDDITPEPPKA